LASPKGSEVQRFTELKVWQRSHSLTLDIYRLTAGYPPEERFGLVSQLRRAAVSVGANLAEGAKRRSSADYARVLNIAEGSLAELESLLMLGRFLDEKHAARLLTEADEIARMLSSLRKRVAQSTLDS
jgi:four helix bundle protein